MTTSAPTARPFTPMRRRLQVLLIAALLGYAAYVLVLHGPISALRQHIEDSAQPTVHVTYVQPASAAVTPAPKKH